MRHLWSSSVLVASLAFASANVKAALEEPSITVIQKDVAIIGGGASGAYSAVRLREDFDLSVVLIEKEAILVGRELGRPHTQPIGDGWLTAFRVGMSTRMTTRLRESRTSMVSRAT